MRYTTSALFALFVISSSLAQTLPPSLTASVGCEPHGGHWHCDGPASALSTTLATTATHDHDDEAGYTGTLAPSPTESIGCEPHGDHWHCDGPAVTSTGTAATSVSTSTSATAPVSPGGVCRLLTKRAALAGGLALALL